MKYKYNGQVYDVSIKALDSMPVGSIVEYDGQVSDIPAGWEQYDDGETIWTNSNPNNTFASQNITLDMSNYEYIKIIYTYYTTSSTYLKEVVVKVGYNSALEWIGAGGDDLLSRNVLTTTTTLGFQDAYRNRAVNNTYLIPLEVIGYK